MATMDLPQVSESLRELPQLVNQDERAALSLLAGAVKLSTSPGAVEKLSSNEHIWKHLQSALEVTRERVTGQLPDTTTDHLTRILRGIFVLARNLVAAPGVHELCFRSQFYDSSLAATEGFTRFQGSNERKHGIWTEMFRFYSNLVAGAGRVAIKVWDDVLSRCVLSDVWFGDTPFAPQYEPFYVFLCNAWKSDSDLQDFVTIAAEQTRRILGWLLDNSAQLEIGGDSLPPVSVLVLAMVRHLLENPACASVCEWLGVNNADKRTVALLQLSHAILAGSDLKRMSVEPITAWLAGAVFPVVVGKVCQLLEHEEYRTQDFQLSHATEIDEVWNCTVSALECLCLLAQTETGKQFLVTEGPFVDQSVRLLAVVTQRVPKKTLKGAKSDGNSQVTQRNPVKTEDFPNVKALVVELLCYLTYKERLIQDELRTNGAIVLILNCCVIDDNNPYIKERAIMCLRYLLENNEENQAIVAGLEAHGTEDTSALRELGFDVKVVDGKVKVVPTER